jgi:hypothetical protein
MLANAQDQIQKVFGPLSIETPDGKVELRDFRLWEYSSLRPGFIGPRPSGLIENHTGIAWEKLKLMVRFQCPGLAPQTIPIFFYNIGESESQGFKSSSSDADNFCDAHLLEITFDHGINARATEREAAEARQAEARRRAAAAATPEGIEEARRLAEKEKEDARRLAEKEKAEAEEAAQLAAAVTAETKRLASKIVALRVPGGNDGWVGTDNCLDALRLYTMRRDELPFVDKTESAIRLLGSKRILWYNSDREVAVLSRGDNCAKVRFIEDGRDLYIAGVLVPKSRDERAAAARSAEAEKDRADRAAALAKLQTDREAQERARVAIEKAKLQARCAAVFKATGNKKVSDITVVESQQVQACTTLGMYHQ